MKDIFIVWFGFVFTETQLAVKKKKHVQKRFLSEDIT